MASNKDKTDRLSDLLPSHLNSKTNPNWQALLQAIGDQDQNTADLISEVRKQFFIKTASRPYLDRLAANQRISRPKLVGMDDSSFKQYIPVLSYTPKQVKLIIDKLLDIFFFKESTTAFVTSQIQAPFALQDGWELEYLVDENRSELIKFNANEFTSISNASAAEIVAAFNRQAKYGYATAYYDSITKNTYIRLFTSTVGSKGSLRITGGRANIALHFNSFIESAGNGANTEWTISKIGDVVTFTHTAGSSPGLNSVQAGDVVIINISGNVGSFAITNVDLSADSIQFKNLFATTGVFTQTDDTQVKFISPDRQVAYTNPRRAMTWETSPGEIVVEMPTSPPVVKRSLKGSMHINGSIGRMANRDSDNSLTMDDARSFPNSGSFWLERADEIMRRVVTSSENTILSSEQRTRLNYKLEKYQYSSRTVLTTTGDIIAGSSQITNLASTVGLAINQTVFMDGVPGYAYVTSISGSTANLSTPAILTSTLQAVSFGGNTLTGITPSLPVLASLNETTLTSLGRTGNVVTATTSTAHGYLVGEIATINNCSGINTVTTTGNITSGSNQVTSLSSISNIAPGQIISGTGIPVGTTILAVSTSSLTMSATATVTNVGTVLNFNEDLNGNYPILSVSSNTFTYQLLGKNGTATSPGTARVERIGLSNTDSRIILTNAVNSDTSRIKGSYAWNPAAPFVLSSFKATTLDNIQAGKIVRLLDLGVNSIPSQGGSVIFSYGLNNQEGPIRYLYKPTDTTIALDPSYVFKHTHQAGSAIVAIRTKGPHIMSTHADEYPPYITNPSDARAILEDLIRSVKSAGIFVNFLVRYPDQLYGTLDVYQSGVLPG